MSTHSVEKTSAKAFKEKVEVALDLGCHIGVTSELFQEMIKRIEELEATEASLIVQKAASEASVKSLVAESAKINEQFIPVQAKLSQMIKDYRAKTETMKSIINEVIYLALTLDKYAVVLFKARDNDKPISVVDTEKFLMDKAQAIRQFLLMHDLV